MKIYDVVIKPLITEKSASQKEANNVLAFQVHIDANKLEIKNAVQSLFNVDVKSVRTVNVSGKLKRVGRFTGKRSNWKKAYVVLGQDSKIDFFEV